MKPAELPAPVDHGAQGSLPGRKAPPAGVEHSEPVVEPCGDLPHIEHSQPRGGQFQGQRKAVQAAAQLCHRRRVGRGQPKTGDTGGGATAAMASPGSRSKGTAARAITLPSPPRRSARIM